MDRVNGRISITFDDVDLSDIEVVSRDFVVVKRSFVNVHYYYIPISKVEGWYSHVLWLKITEEEVKRNYERDLIPDPTRYYVKDHTAYSPDLLSRTYKDSVQVYKTHITYVLLILLKLPRYLMCLSFINDVCGSSGYKTEDELSYHVRSTH